MKNEFVIRCENNGIISAIISENMELKDLFIPGEFWLQFVQAYSLINALEFFSGVNSQKQKAKEELIFMRNQRLYTLVAFGVKDGDYHVLLFFTVLNENYLFDKLMNTNNEQIDLYRNALKMITVRGSNFDKTSQDLFGEISRMNNEVVNAQRELACKNRELIEKLESLVLRDPLTNLYNRRFFEAELKRQDVPNNLPISIVMVDVNGLKLINDSFGHPTGDKILIMAAEKKMLLLGLGEMNLLFC
jgi:predicted signal transduction protein with EAL and GGDEF domain